MLKHHEIQIILLPFISGEATSLLYRAHCYYMIKMYNYRLYVFVLSCTMLVLSPEMQHNCGIRHINYVRKTAFHVMERLRHESQVISRATNARHDVAHVSFRAPSILKYSACTRGIIPTVASCRSFYRLTLGDRLISSDNPRESFNDN